MVSSSSFIDLMDSSSTFYFIIILIMEHFSFFYLN